MVNHQNAPPRLHSRHAADVGRQNRLNWISGRIAATAKTPDEVDALKRAGATTVFNIYTEAGAGFAARITQEGS